MTVSGDFKTRAAGSLVRRIAFAGTSVTYTTSAGVESTIMVMVTRKRGSDREFVEGGEALVMEIEGIFSADPAAEAYGETVSGIASPAVDDVISWEGDEYPIVSLEPKDNVQSGWRFQARRRDMKSRSGSGKYVRRG